MEFDIGMRVRNGVRNPPHAEFRGGWVYPWARASEHVPRNKHFYLYFYFSLDGSPCVVPPWMVMVHTWSPQSPHSPHDGGGGSGGGHLLSLDRA